MVGEAISTGGESIGLEVACFLDNTCVMLDTKSFVYIRDEIISLPYTYTTHLRITDKKSQNELGTQGTLRVTIHRTNIAQSAPRNAC